MINNAALERISNLFLLYYRGTIDFKERFEERHGYKEACYLLVSHLLYGKNIVIEKPNQELDLFIQAIIKTHGFKKLQATIRWEFQLVTYIPELLDVLSSIMPGFAVFNKEERDSLLETAKQLERAMKAGEAVSPTRVEKITRRLQLLNEAEKTGGLIIANQIVMADVLRVFNTACFRIRRNWNVCIGRLFATIRMPNYPVTRGTMDAAESIMEGIPIAESNDAINLFLGAYDHMPGFFSDRKVVIVFDRLVNNNLLGEDADRVMRVLSLLPFYLSTHGANIVGAYIPLLQYSLANDADEADDRFEVSLECILKLMDKLTEYSYRRHSRYYDVTSAFIDDVTYVIISLNNSNNVYSPFCEQNTAAKPDTLQNVIHLVLNVDDLTNAIKEVISNEAGI